MGETSKIKSEYSHFASDCDLLKEELKSKELVIIKCEKEKEILKTKVESICKELAVKEERFEASVNEKLKPFEMEMSHLQIEIDKKENEILALEEKLEVALVKMEKTIQINIEVSNNLSEKTLELEEAVITIKEQRKEIEEKEELL